MGCGGALRWGSPYAPMPTSGSSNGTCGRVPVQHYESILERLILPDLGDTKIVTLTPARVREWHAGPR